MPEASILFVDDDPLITKLVCHFLAKKNYEVESCSSGEASLERLSARTYDLVIFDHFMKNGLSGVETLKEVRNRGNDVAVIILTGSDEQQIVVEAMHNGASDFVKKTGDATFLSKLESSVSKALRVTRLEQEMKAAHQALGESEKRYRQLFMGGKAVQLIVDPSNGRIVDANHAACEFYGYEREELLQLHTYQINTLTQEQIQTEMENASTDRRTHFYFEHRLKDGSTCPVEVHAGPIELDGRPHIYSIIHDVSERRRAEEFTAGQHRAMEKLARQEPLEAVLDELTEMLETLCDNAKFAIFSVDESGDCKVQSAPSLDDDLINRISEENVIQECLPLGCATESIGFEITPIEGENCQTCNWLQDRDIQNVLMEPIYSSKKELVGKFFALVNGELLNGRREQVKNFLSKNAAVAGVAIEHYAQIRSIENQAEFMQAILDALPTPVYFKDADGIYQGCNKALTEYFGYSAEEVIGRHLSAFYPPDVTKKFTFDETELLATGKGHVLEGALQVQGEERHVIMHKARYIDPQGKAGVVGALVDITKRKLYENELRLAQTVFDTTSEAIVVTDLKNRIQAINPSFTHVTGYTEHEVLGRDPSFLSSGRQDRTFYERMWEQLEATGRWQGEIWNRRKNGDLYAEWLSISSVYDINDKVSQYVAVFSDITKRKRAEEIIRHQANYDALTNLPNRSLFLDRLNRSMMRSRRNGTQVALMFLDLDRFKWVNDTLGHNIGDLLLQETAVRIEKCVRETDTVSRLGGDEFTVVLPDLRPSSDVDKIAHKILDVLSQPFHINEHEIFLSGSVGITRFPDDGNDMETLMRNADTAMYRAKETGRNAYRFFTADMNAETQEHMILERDMRQGIERGEFVVHFQPVINVKTGAVVSCEALVRWQHPERGLLGPGYFISIAEETGLINAIGDVVLHQVCEQIREWQSNPVMKDIKVAVNLSPRQLMNDNLVEELKGIIDKNGVSPQSLALEITETLVMQDPEGAAKLLEDIRALGIKISLDDFGTGYSSLNYLKRFSFDVLKIDRSFIMDVESDAGDAALVEAIVVMAHKLGIQVVAEGVENEQQRSFVSSHECDYIQGYFYSKPLDSASFTDFCEKAGK